MATTDNAGTRPVSAEQRWYALDPEDVASRLGVDVDSGLSASEAAERLRRDGPNALPEEKPPSKFRRLLGQYTSYMQIILVAAAVVSCPCAGEVTAARPRPTAEAIRTFILRPGKSVTALRSFIVRWLESFSGSPYRSR